MSASRTLRAALVAASAAAVAAGAGSCIEKGYPLAKNGTVLIQKDVASALYATNNLGAEGAPEGARQSPFFTRVTLTINEGSEAAYGAYVFVRIDPPQALVLVPDPDEKDTPTCENIEGAFRCTADESGHAKFIARSESDWSGNSTVRVTWSDTGIATAPIPINPPGLPSDASNFELVLGTPTSHINAEFTGLECTLAPVDTQPDEKWRPGKIRAIEAYARATPPSNVPSVVENAPVLVETLSSEVGLSLVDDCASRESRLPLLLGPDGESPRFYVCFSDIGGEGLKLALSSGQQSGDDAPPDVVLDVDPEPRLLRVSTIVTTPIIAGDVSQPLYQIDAYDANRDPITMAIDLSFDNPGIIELDDGVSVTVSGPNGILVDGSGLAPGTATLHVTPRLLASPDCAAAEVIVQ